MPGAASRFAGRGRSERPMVHSPDRACPEQPKHSRVSLPFAGCFVCELWILPNARCLPFVSPLPSCAIPGRQRGSFIMTPCPRQCLATYFIPPLAQPSCVPVPPPSVPPTTHSSTVVLLRPSSLRPFTTLPPEHPTRRPAVSPSPSLPQKTQVAQPQPRRLIDHPCVTCLPLTRHLRVTATIDLDLNRRPSRKTLLALLRW
jgi:hypothetical protein